MDKSEKSFKKNKALMSEESTTSTTATEESSWTWYFEEFMASKQQETCSDVVVCGSSMVSDAASYAAWRSSANHEKLCSKKRKNMKVFYDDSLEDTATSPSNSSKIQPLDHKDIDQLDVPQAQVVCDGDDDDEQERREDEVHELKKRGLCLVPFSMFIDYIG